MFPFGKGDNAWDGWEMQAVIDVAAMLAAVNAFAVAISATR
jgi:hypothetical protein